MKARILVDNVTKSDLKPEWGLSVWIEYEGHSILLDTGASGLFAENAEAMGISISKAEFAVLSHAHYDHGDGLDCFFEQNPAAKVYLQKGIQENCYSRNDGPFEKYIGLKKGLLSQYADRFCYIEGAFSPVPGVTLLSHTTPGLEKTGETQSGLLRDGQPCCMAGCRGFGFCSGTALAAQRRPGLCGLLSGAEFRVRCPEDDRYESVSDARAVRECGGCLPNRL